jgi:hypothetical protein
VSRVSPLVSSPEPSSAHADAEGDLGPAPLLLAETTDTQPQAAPARTTPAVDATGQASLLPATGKPDRRRKTAGEPEDEPTATADLDRWVARYVELKRPPFPPALTKEDRIFFFQQRKARGVEELLWVLDVLHGDSWSAHSTVRQLLSAEAAQKAAGLGAKDFGLSESAGATRAGEFPNEHGERHEEQPEQLGRREGHAVERAAAGRARRAAARSNARPGMATHGKSSVVSK